MNPIPSLTPLPTFPPSQLMEKYNCIHCRKDLQPGKKGRACRECRAIILTIRGIPVRAFHVDQCLNGRFIPTEFTDILLTLISTGYC